MKPPWTIRSVVFDLDGLLIDTEPTFAEAARRLLARRGKELLPDVMRQIMGTPAREALPLFRDRHELTDSLEVLAAEYREDFFAALGENGVTLMPGALDLLDRLERKGTPFAMATSSTAAYVEKVLGPHCLLPRFAFVLTADDVTQGKPHPEIYQKAAARFGYAPGEILVLEDSVNGLRAAKAAGARCVVVPHGLVNVNDLAGADAMVPRLDAPALWEMLEW
jgi:HAD superfamily hydrolase (TIGR01509 family)